MQEAFITAVVKRVAIDAGVHERGMRITTRNGSGGVPAAKKSLDRFLRGLEAGDEERPDILVICLDGDCEGPDARRDEVQRILGDRGGPPPCVVIASPDPYVERWYLLDNAAIKRALGQGPGAYALPPRCSHEVFKDLLSETIEAAGAIATLGGYEYADMIAGEMNLYRAGRSDPSFQRFISDLRGCFRLFLNSEIQ